MVSILDPVLCIVTIFNKNSILIRFSCMKCFIMISCVSYLLIYYNIFLSQSFQQDHILIIKTDDLKNKIHKYSKD